MPHALHEHPLPGMDEARLSVLEQAGLSSLEDVVDAGPERLSTITGFDLKTCRALVRVAESALVRAHPDVIELLPQQTEAPARRLARGLKAARRIERAISLVRKARSHVGHAPEKKSWRRSHRRARRQLKRLLANLEVVQQAVLSDGLTEFGYDQLKHDLGPLEVAIQGALESRVRKRTYKRLSRIARHTRTLLETGSSRVS